MSNIVNTIIELAVALVIGVLIGSLATAAYKNSEQKIALSEQQDKFNAAVQLARDAKDEADRRATDIEHASIKKIAEIEMQHQIDMGATNESRIKAIADLRDGSKRLRVAVSTNTCSRSKVPRTSTNTSRPSNQETADIPRIVAERLISRASEADQVVLERNACVDILKKERELFNKN